MSELISSHLHTLSRSILLARHLGKWNFNPRSLAARLATDRPMCQMNPWKYLFYDTLHTYEHLLDRGTRLCPGNRLTGWAMRERGGFGTVMRTMQCGSMWWSSLFRDALEDLRGAVCSCSRCGPQGFSQAHFGERVDDPFGRIKIIPVRPVPIIARIGMMIVVVTLPEGDQRDPPVIAAGIRHAMGLSSP
jgi:hypothetical protein